MLEGLSQAIEKIAQLGVKADEPKQLSVGNKTYIDTNMRVIEHDTCSCMDLNSLTATCDYVRDIIESQKFSLPLIINISYDNVFVRSGLDDRLDRDHISRTQPLIPSINFNRYMSMEEFVIQLQTCFEETENKKHLLEIVSKITEEASVELCDDGISQTVKVTNGTAVKKEGIISTKPIISLQAYRTFLEVKQPSSLYLLRVMKGGNIALFEADGGKWKYEAQKNVSEFFKKDLEELITAKKVIVVG